MFVFKRVAGMLVFLGVTGLHACAWVEDLLTQSYFNDKTTARSMLWM